MKTWQIFGVLVSVSLVACHKHDVQTVDTSAPKQTAQTKKLDVERQSPKSVITPDWGVAGTLTALGVPPVATGDVKTYPDWSLEPKLAPNTLDLGARFNINPELAKQLSAELVIDGAFYSHMSHLYADVPVYFYEGVAQKNIRHWEDYATATQKLAKAVGKEQNAKQYIAQSRKTLQELGTQFKQKYPNIKSLAVVQFASAQQIRSYTNSSPFAAALEEMGLSLYVFGDGNVWGSTDIGLIDLTKLDEQTCLVIIKPFSPMLQKQLSTNALWQALGFGHRRCMLILPPVWSFGEIPSMVGFAKALNQS